MFKVIDLRVEKDALVYDLIYDDGGEQTHSVTNDGADPFFDIACDYAKANPDECSRFLEIMSELIDRDYGKMNINDWTQEMRMSVHDETDRLLDERTVITWDG